MGSIFTLARKDLRLLWRDKFGMFWVLLFPLMFALFFGAIFSSGGSDGTRSLKIAVVDQDSTDASQVFVEKLIESEALNVIVTTLDSARQMVRKGKKVAYIVLEEGFGEKARFSFASVPPMSIGIDPARRAEALYLRGILTQLTFEDIKKIFTDPQVAQQRIRKSIVEIDSTSGFDPRQRQLFRGFLCNLDTLIAGIDADTNMLGLSQKGGGIKIESVERESEQGKPRSSFEIFFPSAILWGLMGCAATFAISIVQERTRGTYLRLLIAPISRAHILAGKGMACFLSCVGVCVMLLFIGSVALGVRIDSYLALLLAIICVALCFVGIMMAVSVLGRTEQAVGGAGWAMLLIMAMAGGGMVPTMVMPKWLQTIGSISPVKWGILSLEGAIWRNFSLNEMMLPLGVLLGFGTVFFVIGVTVMSRYEL